MPQLPPTSSVRRARARFGVTSATIGIAVALSLSGCVGGSGPAPTVTTTVTPSPTGTAPAIVELKPDGTAQENLAFFDKTNRATLAAKPTAQGRDFIDALVAAGFKKPDMQVTADTTTIGLKANSIQFSVRMGKSCLIGQNGADAGGYNSQVTPVLGTGRCLIGSTRTIDW
ncbi:DUF6993 domain-containing protein [Leifsonia poae]|uniref:DUF6993 domain-containing protein n=1 Tax=Leifsonia poae TaxID=110933 RepID=UPI001CBF9027|nr:hypothetical protein [Leifsonia poae]